MNNDFCKGLIAGILLSTFTLCLILWFICSPSDSTRLKGPNTLLNSPHWTIDTLYHSADKSISYQFKYIEK